MLRIEPIIGVQDVQKSSAWYQEVFNLNSGHGGGNFEILKDNSGKTILCLHKWGEHEHPTLSKSSIHDGNGLILYMRVKKLDVVWQKAKMTASKIEFKPQLNVNSGENEFAVRDLDGYYLLVSE